MKLAHSTSCFALVHSPKDAMANIIEQTLAVVMRCFIYKIPPAKTVAGHNATDWGLDNPLNKSNPLKVKVVEIGENCVVRIEEVNTNQLFLETPYISGSIDRALDSSRYFVMRVVDPTRPNTHAFIGIGFQERDEAYEFENALRTHDKYAQRQAEIERQNREWAAQHQDLSLKSGQTISVSIKTDPSKTQKREPRTAGGIQFNFAAPPTGGGFFAPPPVSTSATSSSTPMAAPNNQSDWLSSLSPPAQTQTPSQSSAALDFFSASTTATAPTTAEQTLPTNADDWADFSSASNKNPANDSWAQF